MFFLLVACGSTTPSPGGPVILEGPPASPPSTPRPPPPRPARAPLTRSALVAVLDAGPGAFLATVRVTAARQQGRFVGWEIDSLWPGADVDLAPGDIVTAVNGRSIERPEALPELWQSLRGATEIVVDYRRGLEARTARFPVVEDRGGERP